MNKENNIKFQKQMNKYQEDCFISLENDCIACEQIKEEIYTKVINKNDSYERFDMDDIDKIFNAAFNAGIKWERSRK